MKRIRTVIVLVLLPLFVFAQDKISIREGKTQIRIISQDINHIDLEIELGSIYLTKTENHGEIYWKLSGDGLKDKLGNGEPMLPQIVELIQIPVGATTEVIVTEKNSDYINLNSLGVEGKLLPARNSMRKTGDIPVIKENQRIYESDKFYKPEQLAQSQTMGIMRNIRYGQLSVTPFEYNPVKNILKIYTKLKISVYFKNPDLNKTQELYTKYYIPGSDNFTINKLFTLKSVGVPTSFPMTYVIVAPAEFKTSKKLQEFIAWKKRQGYKIIEGYAGDNTGTTKEDIKNWLEGLYYNPPEGYNPPAYVLFIGDISNMPSWVDASVNNSPYTDLFYVDYTNDHRPEVDWGRLSAEDTTELYNALSKIIYYERDQFSTDYSHLKQVLLVPGNDEDFEDNWGNGQIRYGVTYYFNSAHNINAHTFYQDPEDNGVPGGNTAVHDSIIANVNNGLSFANYTAHCSPNGWYLPSFTLSDLDGLTNFEKYGIWLGNCCQSNKYDAEDAFSEKALYIANKGAAAYIGGSQYTYWDEDYWWGVGLTSSISPDPSYSESGRGAYDAMFHDLSNEINNPETWALTVRQIIHAGNLAVDASSSSLKNYYWTIYQVMGDPSMTTKIGTPQTTTLSLTQSLVGTNTISGTTLPYTYVAISQNGELLACGISDANGYFDFQTLFPIEATYLDIVAYGQNRTTLIKSEMAYVPDSPYLIVTGLNPDTIKYNSTTPVGVVIRNINNDYSATDVSVVISSQDPDLLFPSDSVYIGNFAAGDTVFFDSLFDISVLFPKDKHSAILNFKIYGTYNDSVYIWKSYQKILLRAPVPEITSITVADYNNNGYSDLGANDTLIVRITNTGGADATGVTVSASTDNVDVAIQQSSLSIDLLAGDTVTVKFPYTVPADAIEGMKSLFKVTANQALYSDSDSIYQWIGLPLELLIGNGTVDTKYPFYNYYENERSIFLYKMSDFQGAKLISSIGFLIKSGDPWTFKNLRILLKETDLQTLDQFPDMTFATEVYNGELVDFPGSLDSQYFSIDINPYFYTGEKNLLVEIVWGDNNAYQSLGAIIYCYGTETEYNATAYGYDDSQTPPELRGVSQVIANTRFEFQAFGHTFIRAEQYTDTLEHDRIYYLPLQVVNYGRDTAFDAIVTLSTQEDNVKIINPSVVFDTVPPNAIVTKDSAIVIETGSLNNGQKIKLTAASDNTSTDLFFIISAPELQITEKTLLSENGQYINGGEQAQLLLKVVNAGLDTAKNVTLATSVESDNLTAYTLEKTTDILPGDTAIFTIDLQSAETDQSEKTKLSLTLTTDNYTFYDSAFVWINIPEETIIGKPNYATSRYPFFQYYENEKTQIVYLSNEFDTLPLSINRIGFYISSIDNMETLIPLKYFSIKMFKTDMDQVVNSYLSTISEPVTVYNAEQYLIPSEGWIYFDLTTPFLYDGNGNLAVEITWGDNQINTVDDIWVGADSTETPSVAYGYALSQTPPGFGYSSYLRPVTYFAYELSDAPSDNSVTVIIYPNPVSEIFSVGSNYIINSLTMFTPQGQVLQSWTPNSNTYSIDVTNLAKGVYFLKIVTEGGTVAKKVVVN